MTNFFSDLFRNKLQIHVYLRNVYFLYKAVRTKRNNSSSIEEDEEAEVIGRVAGTVRRHIPIDTRDPLGAILHFYVGDSYDSNR